jgi:uncharacterized heparinase superfamily protein
MGNHLLENALGLVCAASVTRGGEAEFWWKLGSTLLSWQLENQFLPDGGHFELSASYHLLLTAGLLEAIELARAGERSVPESWRGTATRALAWAQCVRAPDGTYPLFNDASLDSAPTIDSVIELGRSSGIEAGAVSKMAEGPWVHHLPSTGWLLASSQDGAWLCVDAGPDGAPYQPGHVHADALTFELWVEGQRSIVDFGVSSYARDAARAETRSTRSHNTVELEGYDSCEVWHTFRVGRRCRSRVVRVEREAGNIDLQVAHDGYSWLPGRPIHHRRVSFGAGFLQIFDSVVGGTHLGVSHLRVASEAKRLVDVKGASEATRRPGFWYPNFADLHEATVFAQPVSTERESSWAIRW